MSVCLEPEPRAVRATADRSTPPDSGRLARVQAELLAVIAAEIEHPQWARNWAHLLAGFGPTELSALAAALDQPAAPTHAELESLLVSLQRARIQRRADPAKKTVAVYFPTAAYREQLGTIPARLRAAGCHVVTIVGTVCADQCERAADVFYGGHCGQTEIVNHLDFVDVFLTPVIVSGLPARAKKVYFLHDIHDSPLGDEATTRKISEALREFDYVFLPSQASVDLFKQVVPLARTGADQPLTLIAGGYPKLDRLRDYFQTHQRDARTLIYAPTVIGYGFDEVVSLPGHGDAIIDAVLQRIPDYKLIFRPHPHTLHLPVVRALAAKYQDHPRFVFDDNASFYMDHYSEAALMISDVSGTAFTYAFATERPVVFFSPDEAAVRAKFAGLRYVKDREQIGCVVTDVIDLVDKINLILRHRDEYQAAVRQCRDANIFNVGQSEAYFAAHLEQILNGQPHPDWLTL